MDARPTAVLRVLVVRQGRQWLAQGLEYDLAAQGTTNRAAIRSFVRIFRARIERDRKLGREPLSGIPQAPERFLEAWKVSAQRPRWRPATSVEFGGDRLPTYILHAIAQNAKELGLT